MTVAYSSLQRIVPIQPSSVPSFVTNLPVGQFRSIPGVPLSPAQAITASGYVGGYSGTARSIFTDWVASVWSQDVDGGIGGVYKRGAGHNETIQCGLLFGCGTLAWKVTNIPSFNWTDPSTNPSVNFINADQEYNDNPSTFGTTALGVPCASTYSTHSYDAPFIIPASSGGGPNGSWVFPQGLEADTSILPFGTNGPPYDIPCVHALDLSKTNMGYSRITPPNGTTQAALATGLLFGPLPGSPGGIALPPGNIPFVPQYLYGSSDCDNSRQGAWLHNVYGIPNTWAGHTPGQLTGIVFAKNFTAGSTSSFQQTLYPDNLDHSNSAVRVLKYMPAFDLLVLYDHTQTLMARPASAAPGTQWTVITQTGTKPFLYGSTTGPLEVSLRYSPSLQRMVYYDGARYQSSPGFSSFAQAPQSRPYGYNEKTWFTVGPTVTTNQAAALANPWNWAQTTFTPDPVNYPSGAVYVDPEPSGTYFTSTLGGYFEVPLWSTPGHPVFITTPSYSTTTVLIWKF